MAFVVDVDLCARDFGDAADVLATRTDECANFVGCNLDRVDAWRVLAEILTGLRHVLRHDSEDLHTCIAVLLDSFECDVEWQTCDLKIKLEAGDTFWCASNLEVHVAEVIFCAEDVSEENALGDVTIRVLFSN